MQANSKSRLASATNQVVREIITARLSYPTSMQGEGRPEMFRRFLFNPDAGGGSGGGGTQTPPAQGTQQQTGTQQTGQQAGQQQAQGTQQTQTTQQSNEPAKLSLTQAELDARINDALANKAKEDEKARKQAEREKAQKDGDTAALLKSEQDRATALEAEKIAARKESNGLRMQMAVRDYLADKPQYLPAAKYIERMVSLEDNITPETLANRVKAAADEFIKDNPRATTATTGTPPPPARGSQSTGTTTGNAGGQQTTSGQQQTNGQGQTPPPMPRYMQAF